MDEEIWDVIEAQAQISQAAITVLLDLVKEIILHLDDDELTNKARAKVGAAEMAFRQSTGRLLDTELS